MGNKSSNDNLLTNKPIAQTSHQNFLSQQQLSPSTEYIHLMLGISSPNQPKMFYFDQNIEKIIQLDPPSVPIYNYSSIVMLDPNHIYITGGITKNLKEITKIVYEINSTLPIKFTSLPSLNIARYTHMSIINKDFLYAIGGRTYGTDDVGILNQCECFDLKKRKWNSIAKMKKPRCTGFLIIYQEIIYAFGGYTGPKKRSKLIERYDDSNNLWQSLEFKLCEGVEAGSIYPIDLDEFVIVGGNCRNGNSAKSYLYNIQKKTVEDYPNLIMPRVLQKTFIDYKKGNIYVLGGDFENTCEKLNYLKNEKWELLDLNFHKFLERDEIKAFGQVSQITVVHSVNKSLPPLKGQSLPPLKGLKSDLILNQQNKEEFKSEELPHSEFDEDHSLEFVKEKDNLFQAPSAKFFKNINQDEEKKEDDEPKIEPDENDERIYLFGTDTESIIIEYNLTKNHSRAIQVQEPLKLQCYQAGVKTSHQCYFLVGGINSKLDTISTFSYLYMSQENIAFRLDPMKTPRYTFNIVYQYPWIYALGGRTYGSDELGILNTCERFHLEKQNWETIASLNFKRCTAMAFSWSNGIYMAGGYLGSLKREKRFECYFEAIDKWELMGIELEDALEASSFLITADRLLFIGGRNHTGDTDKIWSYDVSNGFDAFHGEQVGNMKIKRCLHKTFQIDKMNFLILGGNVYDNVCETFSYDKEKNVVITHGEKAFEELRKAFLINVKKYFKDSSLHKQMLL